MATSESIIGTSMSTPTTVAKEAPESRPKRAMAIATASSKKLLAAIMDEGAQMACFSFKNFPANQLKKKIK